METSLAMQERLKTAGGKAYKAVKDYNRLKDDYLLLLPGLPTMQILSIPKSIEDQIEKELKLLMEKLEITDLKIVTKYGFIPAFIHKLLTIKG